MTEDTPHQPPRWPVWAIVAVGAVATVVALVWAGATYDDHGEALIDGPMSIVLAAAIPALLTTIAAFGARSLGQIKHEVKPNHGSSMADAVRRIEASVEQVKHTQHVHGEALARLKSVPAEVGGIRRDVGRLMDADQQMRREFADHVTTADRRLTDLERKKEQ